MHSLPLFVKLSGRPVVIVGHGDAAEAKARLVRRAGGIVVDEDTAEEARLAFVALDDEEEAREAVERLRGRGLLVNAVDRPEFCDFTTPAIVDRDPVIIAIATGGASAGLAKALRQRIEALFPASLGSLADAMKRSRGAIKARWPDASDRRRAIDRAFRPGGTLDPLNVDDRQIESNMADWLNSDGASEGYSVETVRLTSDDPDELTLRAARLLGEADHVVHAADCPPAILARARADAARHAHPCDTTLLDGLVVEIESQDGGPE